MIDFNLSCFDDKGHLVFDISNSNGDYFINMKLIDDESFLNIDSQFKFKLIKEFVSSLLIDGEPVESEGFEFKIPVDE